MMSPWYCAGIARRRLSRSKNQISCWNATTFGGGCNSHSMNALPHHSAVKLTFNCVFIEFRSVGLTRNYKMNTAHIPGKNVPLS